MSDMPCSIASHLLPVRRPRRLTRDDARRPAAASASACCSLSLLTVTLRLIECTHRHGLAIRLQDNVFVCIQFFSVFVQRACSFSGVDELRGLERGSPSFSYDFRFRARRHFQQENWVLIQLCRPDYNWSDNPKSRNRQILDNRSRILPFTETAEPSFLSLFRPSYSS